MPTTLDSRAYWAVNTVLSKYGYLLKDKEVRDNFYMQEFDGAASGDEASQEWVKSLNIDKEKYKNALNDEDPRPEEIQQFLVMWQMSLGKDFSKRSNLRRAVINELMKVYPLNDG